jgi:branched-chain amino acid transport system substrate-binding protein
MPGGSAPGVAVPAATTSAGGATVSPRAPGAAKQATGGSAPAPGRGSAGARSATAPGSAASSGGPGTAAGGSGTASSPGPSPTAEGAAAPPTPGAPKAPVTIGNVSTLSGPAASGELPGLDGLQIWVKWVNARGGANGHLVKLVVADDNSDGARHRQLVQELVEQKGVVAFVQQGEALTGAGSVDYITKKGVPVINSEGANDYFYKSPMYFAIAAHGEELIKASLYNSSAYARSKKVTKYGLISCTEAQICNDTMRLNGNADNVRAAGMELVYTARTSLAQPDFTAECIGARNAGVEILQVSLDGNSVGRVAASCARQNYKPLIHVFAAIALDSMKNNPDLDGLSVTSNGFPYTLCDGGARDYCDALKKYGPVTVLGIGNAVGWTAAKAFQRAMRNVPDGPVTSQDILEGMWSFQDETLDGLVNPLTFTKGQPSPRHTCWWNMIVSGGRFHAPDGMKVSCI